MVRLIVLTLLSVTVLMPIQATALEPRFSSVEDLLAQIGKPRSLAEPPRYVPATADAQTGGNALIGSVRPAVGTVVRERKLARSRLIALPQARAGVGRPATPGAPPRSIRGPRIQAKAICCVDCGSDKIILGRNITEPLPIASITKLLTAMVVIDGMKLDQVVEVPYDIGEVPPHKVGLRPGDRFMVKDLLHGLLMESGNDCAETLARAYPEGGREGFISEMNRRAGDIGASSATLYTPSGLDLKITLGRKDGRILEATKFNSASAKDVAVIARSAFNYPLIALISSTKTHTITTLNQTPRRYQLASNIRLLHGKLPVAGAKTGFTNLAGRCIVALFKNRQKEHMVVVLNSPRHFKAAENIYRWASKGL